MKINYDFISKFVRLKLKKGTIIKGISGDVRYEIISISESEIKYLRLDAETKDVESISLKVLQKIIIDSIPDSIINTNTIKKYIGGKQSPSIAILKYCELIK